MFRRMIGLAGVLVVAGAAPASACNTGCVSQPTVVYGVAKTWVAPPQPRYYVNHGPTYTGPATYAPRPVYQERGVTGHYPFVSSYPQPYTGGPYADPNNHYTYGSSTSQGPVVYRHHNLPRTYAPVRHYSAAPLVYRAAPRFRSAPRYYAPRYSQAPRHYAPRYRAAPRYHASPRYRVAPVYRSAPRYGVAPRYRAAPRYGYRAPAYAPRGVYAPRVHPAARHLSPRPAPRYHAVDRAPRPRVAPPRYLN